MVDYSTRAPGVYVEEITAAGPISGTGTTTAAFIGAAAAPPGAAFTLLTPVPVTSWTEYSATFGTYAGNALLPHAVRGFFGNGGTLAYIIPVADFTALPDALNALSPLTNIRLVCVPGLVDPVAQQTVLAACEQAGDRFAILDGAVDPKPLDPGGALQKQRSGLTSPSGFGALYWPWISVTNPSSAPGAPDTVPVPPSGHIAGIMARSDNKTGVHKAPANEPVIGAVGLGYSLNATESGILNSLNINALRSFAGSAPMVWGARTLTKDVPWRFVNVRRLVSYVETSLVEGLRWALFTPNNERLWKGLARSANEFLTRVWESGALVGLSPQAAFYVKVDAELNPPAVRDLGQVYLEIGLSVTRPAEFIILKIGLWDGGDPVSAG